jgi:hypothetical protein
MRTCKSIELNERLIKIAEKDNKVVKDFFPPAKDKIMFARQQKLRKGILVNYGIFIQN